MHASLLLLLVLSLSLCVAVNGNNVHVTIDPTGGIEFDADADADADSDANANANANANAADLVGDVASMEAFLKFWEAGAARTARKTNPNPPLLKKFTLEMSPIDFDLIRSFLGCDEASDEQGSDWKIDDPEAFKQIPIPTDADFSLFVESYVVATKQQHERHRQGSSSSNSNSKNYSESEQSRLLRPPSVLSYDPNVFVVPIEVLSIPRFGRGVFATEDIAKGTLVMEPKNVMEFYEKETYRDFLAHMVFKNSAFLCDHIKWMWGAQKSPASDDYVVCMSADSTSLINTGVYVFKGDDDNDDDNNDNDNDNDDDDDDDKATTTVQVDTVTDGDKTTVTTTTTLIEVEEVGNVKTTTIKTTSVQAVTVGATTTTRTTESTTAIVDTKHTKEVVDDESKSIAFNIAQRATKSDSGERILYGCQIPMLSVYATRDIKAGEELVQDHEDLGARIRG